MTIIRTCPMCGKVNAIKVADALKPYIDRYNTGIGYIQDIPLPAEQREFIKTGFCMECQEVLFGVEDD